MWFFLKVGPLPSPASPVSTVSSILQGAVNQLTLANITSDTDHLNLAQSSDNISSSLPSVVGKCKILLSTHFWGLAQLLNTCTVWPIRMVQIVQIFNVLKFLWGSKLVQDHIEKIITYYNSSCVFSVWTLITVMWFDNLPVKIITHD